MDQSPNLALPYILPAQAQKHVTHNEAIRALDALTQIGVASRAVTAPPASPADGDRYLIPTGATGVWSTSIGHLAAFQDGAWAYYTPRVGWIATVADEAVTLVYTATGWSALAGSTTTASTTPVLGVNATADTTNRLTVSSPATLLNHAGSGHQLKLNKANAPATASLLYQDNFSGRAEMGLTGDDDFHVKVSADGATWREALVIASATGKATFPSGGVVTSSAANLTIAVPSTTAPTIQAALDLLTSTHFEGTATGTILVANGTYVLTAPLTCRHPQPSRIILKAATPATLPVEADFTAVKATDEAMIRAKYKVIVECPNMAAWTAADGEGISQIQDIAFIRTGTTGTPAGVSAVRRGQAVLNRCALIGFTNQVQAREQGTIKLTNCQLAHAGAPAIQVQLGGHVMANATLIQTCTGNGIDITHGLFVSESGLRVKGATAIGLALNINGQAALTGANISGNTGWGSVVQLGSRLEVTSCTISGGAGQLAMVVVNGGFAYVQSVTVTGDATQRSFSAYSGSIIVNAGSHTGNPLFSPPFNTTGNSGSWVF